MYSLSDPEQQYRQVWPSTSATLEQIQACYELQCRFGIMGQSESPAGSDLMDIGYVFSFVLAMHSGPVCVMGSPRITKKAARDQAALVACRYLCKIGLFEPSKTTPLRLARSLSEAHPGDTTPHGQAHKKRPKAFDFFPPAHREFYVTVMDINQADGSSELRFRGQTLAVATRHSINAQEIPPFPIWPRGREHAVTIHSLSPEPVRFSDHQMDCIGAFQDAIWGTLGATALVKTSDAADQDDGVCRYFLVLSVAKNSSGGWVIDWDGMSMVESSCTLDRFFA
ncbi:hypothetical protein HDU91_002391, partial [Kappamyces sp. JEL0680]